MKQHSLLTVLLVGIYIDIMNCYHHPLRVTVYNTVWYMEVDIKCPAAVKLSYVDITVNIRYLQDPLRDSGAVNCGLCFRLLR